jgi:hypothetical protein
MAVECLPRYRSRIKCREEGSPRLCYFGVVKRVTGPEFFVAGVGELGSWGKLAFQGLGVTISKSKIGPNFHNDDYC